MSVAHNRKSQKPRRQYLRTHGTLAEKILWYCLKGRQILGFKFRRQHGIGNYILDFYCPELKLAIEADGATHDEPGAKRHDQQRQRQIEAEGIVFLRFGDEEIIGNPDDVIRRIEHLVGKLSEGQSTTPLSPPRGGGDIVEQ